MTKNGNGKKDNDNMATLEAETDLLDGVNFGDAENGEEFIVGFDSIPMGQKMGVMQRLITAVLSDKQYRQVLLTGAFDNKHESNLAADAITERLRYGVTIQPIVDRVIAQCGIKGARVNIIGEILTRYQITHNYGQGGNVPSWKRRQDQGIGGSRMS